MQGSTKTLGIWVMGVSVGIWVMGVSVGDIVEVGISVGEIVAGAIDGLDVGATGAIDGLDVGPMVLSVGAPKAVGVKVLIGHVPSGLNAGTNVVEGVDVQEQNPE